MKEFVTIEEVTEAYLDCRRHKGGSQGAVEYQLDYELNNLQLWRELNADTYEVSPSRAFCVTRPKLREVFCAAFRDRIVHHLLNIKFGALIEAELTDAAFACRKGKGVDYGVRRLQADIARASHDYTRKAWVLKCDLSGFFMSIDRGRLFRMLESLVRSKYNGRDTDRWLGLWRKVVLNRPEQNCVRVGDLSLWDKLPSNKSLFTSGGKGLPIGNLPSQVLANLYMAAFDKWAMAQDGVQGYGRYCDDWYAVSTDKAALLRLLERSRRWLSGNLGLTLHPKKTCLQEAHKGVEFTGAVVKPYGLLPSVRLKRACMDMAHRGGQNATRRWNSYMGFLLQRRSYSFRREMWEALPDKRGLVCVNMRKLKHIKTRNHEM